MTTVTKNFLPSKTSFDGVPFGNVWEAKHHFETDSNGIMVANGAADSDKATAIQNGDVVRLGILPAGLELQDALIIISDAFAGSTTGSIGFLYTDGVDDSTSPQDAAYFASALSTASTSVSRKTGVKAPQTLTKPAYLTLTVGGADHSAVGVMDVIVYGRNTGGF
jgi:hypothetical protein